MVTVATATDELYPVNNNGSIAVKGFVSGNYGSFNRHWLNVNDGDEVPGSGMIRATGASGEDTVDMWGANTELGYAFLGYDRTVLAQTWTNSIVYASTDIAPVYPFNENPGAYFQARVADTDGDNNADNAYDAGATGYFADADLANRVYARQLYFVADTDATAQLIMCYVATEGMGG